MKPYRAQLNLVGKMGFDLIAMESLIVHEVFSIS